MCDVNDVKMVGISVKIQTSTRIQAWKKQQARTEYPVWPVPIKNDRISDTTNYVQRSVHENLRRTDDTRVAGNRNSGAIGADRTGFYGVRRLLRGIEAQTPADHHVVTIATCVCRKPLPALKRRTRRVRFEIDNINISILRATGGRQAPGHDECLFCRRGGDIE